MSRLKTKNDNKFEKLLLKYCKRRYLISWIILLVCSGFASFLISYPRYSVIGFILMILFCSVGFYLFTRLPDSEIEESMSVNHSVLEQIKKTYQKEKRGYSEIKKAFVILLVFFDLFVPIVSSILYYIYDNIQLINYPLALSLIVSGIIIFIWLRRATKLEALRKLMNIGEN